MIETVESFKHPKDSMIEMREIVMQNHINPNHIVFGGVVMSWIDLAAAMCATKHCQTNVVTIHVDDVSFLYPIKVGYHVLIQASINYVGTSSMIIGTRVISENPFTGESLTTAKAYLTFVGLDSEGKKMTVPKLVPETKDEIRRFNNAYQRVLSRKELAKKIKSV